MNINSPINLCDEFLNTKFEEYMHLENNPLVSDTNPHFQKVLDKYTYLSWSYC